MIQFGQAMPVVIYVDKKMTTKEADVPRGGGSKIFNYLLNNRVEGLDPIEKIKEENIDYRGDFTDYDKFSLLKTHGLSIPPEQDEIAFTVLATNDDYDSHLEFNKNPTNEAGIDQKLFVKAMGCLRVFLNGNWRRRGEKVECSPKQTAFQKNREDELLPLIK